MKNTLRARKLRFLHTLFAMERDLIVGGQAVMEGVMMRTPSAYAIACRKSDGEIVTTAERLPVGAQLAGRLGDTTGLLDIAATLERLLTPGGSTAQHPRDAQHGC